MCGIFGAIGDYNKDKIKMLAILNEARGNQATGFYNGDEIIKEAIASTDFIGKHASYFKDRQSRYIMGHTRYATQGKKDDSNNAHPFEYGSIVGTHNGMINNVKELSMVESKWLTVDSEWIFYYLNKRGNIEKALQELDGYWGLAWVDSTKDDKFYLSAHDNTLSYVKFHNVIYYSSDIAHLKTVFGDGANIDTMGYDTLVTIDTNTLEISHDKLHGLQGFKYANWEDGYAGTARGGQVSYLNPTEERCEFCEAVLYEDEIDNIVAEGDQTYLFCNECYDEFSEWQEADKGGTEVLSASDPFYVSDTYPTEEDYLEDRG